MFIRGSSSLSFEREKNVTKSSLSQNMTRSVIQLLTHVDSMKQPFIRENRSDEMVLCKYFNAIKSFFFCRQTMSREICKRFSHTSDKRKAHSASANVANRIIVGYVGFLVASERERER